VFAALASLQIEIHIMTNKIILTLAAIALATGCSSIQTAKNSQGSGDKQIFTGIFIVAYNIEGSWIVPFGILTLVSISLNLDKYSFAWFSIAMHYQQQQQKHYPNKPQPIIINHTEIPRGKILIFFRKLSTLFFHENYVIFYLPILTFFTLFIPLGLIDFRVIIILLGGLINFPIVLSDVFRISKSSRIDTSYNKLFFGKRKPKLPFDHFIE
jgi:uncharacterized protein YceK